MTTLTAHASRSVTFIRGLGSISHYLECSRGDFYQRYEGDASAPSAISPDFTKNAVRISLRVYNSADGQEVSPDNIAVEWEFAGRRLVFDAASGNCTGSIGSDGTSDTTMAGLFQKVAPGNGADYHRLMVKGNLVDIAGGSALLKAVYTVTSGGTATNFSDFLQYTAMQVSGSDYGVHILGTPSLTINCADSSVMNGTTGKNGYVTLSVQYFKGVQTLTPGKVEWELLRDGKFVSADSLIGQAGCGLELQDNGRKLKVTADDVQSELFVRTTVYEDAAGSTGKAMDSATVIDNSDPVVIIPNPTPADMQIYSPEAAGYRPPKPEEDYEGNGQCTFRPVLSTSESENDRIAGYHGTFRFQVFEESGAEINGAVDGTEFVLDSSYFTDTGAKVVEVLISTVDKPSGTTE